MQQALILITREVHVHMCEGCTQRLSE